LGFLSLDLRFVKFSQSGLPPPPSNYHLTFSKSEDNLSDSLRVLKSGGNLATVFRNPIFSSYYLGYPIIDGDNHDFRWMDPKNVIVGLKAPGRAKNDNTGFVVDTPLIMLE